MSRTLTTRHGRPPLPRPALARTGDAAVTPSSPQARGEGRRRETRRFILTALLLALAVPGPASAQQSTPRGPAAETTKLPPPAGLGGGVAATAPPLALVEVLGRVDALYPGLLAAEQEKIIAAGKALAARGVFDHKLKGEALYNTGSYDNQRHKIYLEQNTPVHGLSYFTGYRIGTGEFPVYYGERKTAEVGEMSAGLLLPLLRDRAIDERRALVAQADIDAVLANPFVQAVRIELLRTAAYAYWEWVAAGQNVRLSRTLLQIAEDRNEALEELVRKGNLAGIEVTVNERTILSREAKLIEAERKLQKAAIKLSLFYRDAAGKPALPPADRLPPEYPTVCPPRIDLVQQDVELAWRQRPELVEYQLQRNRVQVDLNYYDNQMLPALNGYAKVAEDIGQGKKGLDRNTYEAGFFLDVPLERRKARGGILAARAKLAQIAHKEQLQRDKILAEVNDAVSALHQAYRLVQRLDENVKLAREVQEAENEKLRLGTSTVVIVNLQEIAAFESEVGVVDARALYFIAYADYRAALGLDAFWHHKAPRPPGPPVTHAGH